MCAKMSVPRASSDSHYTDEGAHKTRTFAKHLRASLGTLPIYLRPQNIHIEHVNLMRW